ncbi:MAG: putative manganese-dependent inorganic diphosphatase [Lachnospiraceae bacterium]
MGVEKERPIYVVGHKNPDTDSICSAIAYANLKNILSKGEKKYIACRAGSINQETQFVLKRFGVEAPFYLSDVMTQVRDMEIRKTKGVSCDLSLRRAWKMMRDLRVVTLPITKQGKLQGVITVSDIATSYMDVHENTILSRAKTPYRNILDTLDAEMLIGCEDDIFDRGEVIIAAANPDIMEEYIHQGDMVILGNRYESQLCAIEMKAACIVVCMGAKVSMTIRKLAEERSCHIIVTPYDTFTVARLINQSMPLEHFMKSEDLTTFRLNERTEDIKEIMGQKRYRDFPILDKNDNYIGMISRRNFLNLSKKQLILVDHNEESQAVDGIEYAEIQEIIDHHRLGSLETMAPVYFRNEPVGCTATIMYRIYNENQVEISKEIAGLLCSAILSDTLMYRSPTCTALDRMAAEQLAKIAGINVEEYAREMFAAGSDLENKQPEEIFYQDFKKFTIGDTSFGVGQINFMNINELETIRDSLIPYIENQDAGVDSVFFMLTDIMQESTDMIFFGKKAKQMMENAFDINPEELTGKKYYRIPGIVSRKKQVVPAFVASLQQ